MLHSMSLYTNASRMVVANPPTWTEAIRMGTTISLGELRSAPLKITVLPHAPAESVPLEAVLRRAFAKDSERERRFLAVKARAFADMERKVKAGELSRIRLARIKKGVDQKELSIRLGMKASNICRLEKPDYNPRINTLKKVAAALGISVKELINE